MEHSEVLADRQKKMKATFEAFSDIGICKQSVVYKVCLQGKGEKSKIAKSVNNLFCLQLCLQLCLHPKVLNINI